MATRRSAEMDGVAPSLTIEDDDDDGDVDGVKKTPKSLSPCPTLSPRRRRSRRRGMPRELLPRLRETHGR